MSCPILASVQLALALTINSPTIFSCCSALSDQVYFFFFSVLFCLSKWRWLNETFRSTKWAHRDVSTRPAPTQNPRQFQETHEEHRGGFNVERWSCSRFLKSGMHHFFFSSYVKFPAPRLPAAGRPSCVSSQDAGFNTEAEALEQPQLVSHKLLEMNDCFETSLCRMNGIKSGWSFLKTFSWLKNALPCLLETHVVQIIVTPPSTDALTSNSH